MATAVDQPKMMIAVFVEVIIPPVRTVREFPMVMLMKIIAVSVIMTPPTTVHRTVTVNGVALQNLMNAVSVTDPVLYLTADVRIYLPVTVTVTATNWMNADCVEVPVLYLTAAVQICLQEIATVMAIRLMLVVSAVEMIPPVRIAQVLLTGML
jgi:hypothetical protein